MLLVFDEFNETDYSHFNVAMALLYTFFLVGVMPILSGKLQIHDAMMLFITLVCEVISSFITPFVATLWQFYLAQGLGAIGYCKYALVRSLMAQCIDSNEVGKVFSLLSILSALVPIGGNPLFRQLYNKTLKNFPGAIFLLYGSILFFSAAGNLFLYFMRHKIKTENRANIEGPNCKMDNSSETESISVM
jgi:MFS-type transporter involved in bile tolerance (Atg22 family)